MVEHKKKIILVEHEKKMKEMLANHEQKMNELSIKNELRKQEIGIIIQEIRKNRPKQKIYFGKVKTE